MFRQEEHHPRMRQGWCQSPEMGDYKYIIMNDLLSLIQWIDERTAAKESLHFNHPIIMEYGLSCLN